MCSDAGPKNGAGSRFSRIKKKLTNGNLTPDCVGMIFPTPYCVSSLIWRNIKEAAKEATAKNAKARPDSKETK